MLIPLGLAGIAGMGLAGWSAYVARRAEEMVPPDGRFADVPGARLHFTDTGPRDAPAIVMVHGLMGQMRNFSYALSERLARDHRVILIDRPGWGHSGVAGGQPGIVAQAAMIAALIDKLDIDRPLLVGHSMGGAVSLALGLERPELVRGLALIAPLSQVITQVPKPFVGLMAPGPLRPVLAWTMAVPVGMAKGQATAQAVFAPDPVPTDFATRGGGALALRPKSYMAGSFELQHAPIDMGRIVPRYGEMQLPVAILYGRDDAVLDPALNGEKTAAEIAGASCTLIDGGHMLPVTHPDATEAWLRAQLSGS